MNGWTQIETPLTLQQKFRLVEIMHETKDDGVRKAAVDLLACALSPPRIVDMSHPWFVDPGTARPGEIVEVPYR